MRYLTTTDIRKIFNLKSAQNILHYEQNAEIPKAERINRGKVSVRQWGINKLPDIGRSLGFLKPKDKQIIICKYIQKGGVLKTTTSFNEARILALNGIKTLIIGLDSECSITDATAPLPEINILDDTPDTRGLYHVIAENKPIKEVIINTDMPTLDIIPETYELVKLDKWLNQQARKEYYFSDYLIPKLNDYDVIIFDNAPNWSNLIENSIVCSNAIICPLGCSLLAYNAANTNLNSLFEFISAMRLKDKKSIQMFATLLDRTSLSQQIYAQYLSDFKDYIKNIPIRSSVKFQEALMEGMSILEHAPTSSISREYIDLVQELWAGVI